jgi:hypothetical protein
MKVMPDPKDVPFKKQKKEPLPVESKTTKDRDKHRALPQTRKR